MNAPPPAAIQCLVVEDSPSMRQVLVLALQRVPRVNVVEAKDGLDALRKVATQRFDLILTDINMPMMDGLKLINRLRGDANHKTVPIIVITTETADEDRQRALTLGANAYLTKPIQANDVIVKVKELLHLPM